MIRTAAPGGSGIRAGRPAGISPGHRQPAGDWGVAPAPSAARRANPSMAELVNGGTGSRAGMGSAATRPRASSKGTARTGRGAARSRMSRRAWG